LEHFDYSSPGAYFVTIAAQNRRPLFGRLNETASIDLNEVGKMINAWWMKLPQKFPPVTLDAHIVMPDHLHGLVLLLCDDESGSAAPVSLSQVMQWFETMTTAEYFRHVRHDEWPMVHQRLWQRSFFDHVVRTERELEEIRKYLEENPGELWERFAGRTHGSAPTS
jgi:REP element-mobilizing transposase RayT